MKLTINQNLQQGIKAHQEDRLKEVQSFYKDILKIEPAHADANYKLAIIQLTMRNTEVTLSFFKKTIISKPYFTEVYSNLCISLRKLCISKEAEFFLTKY